MPGRRRGAQRRAGEGTAGRRRHAVIVGSSFFRGRRAYDPPPAGDLEFAQALAEVVGVDRVIGAVDSKGGQVVIDGWKTALPITAVDAVQRSNPTAASSSTPTSTRKG